MLHRDGDGMAVHIVLDSLVIRFLNAPAEYYKMYTFGVRMNKVQSNE